MEVVRVQKKPARITEKLNWFRVDGVEGAISIIGIVDELPEMTLG